MLAGAAATRGLELPIEPIPSLSEVAAVFDHALPVIGTLDGPWRPGDPDAEGATLALDSLRQATDLAVAGEAVGLVTGPIAKSLLGEVGFGFPGQTEFVAHACGVPAQDAVMMLAGPQLRTIPLTVHVALGKVPELVSLDLIVRKARIAAEGLRRDFGIAVNFAG